MVQTYFPRAKLIDQMDTHLRQPAMASSDLDMHARAFLEWCLTQLQTSKESANMTQLFTPENSHILDVVDFCAPAVKRAETGACGYTAPTYRSGV